MSPENQGVFQLLKEVIFRIILAFWNSWEGQLCLRVLVCDVPQDEFAF